jgi:hypothetical protein
MKLQIVVINDRILDVQREMDVRLQRSHCHLTVKIHTTASITTLRRLHDTCERINGLSYIFVKRSKKEPTFIRISRALQPKYYEYLLFCSPSVVTQVNLNVPVLIT